MIDKQFQAKQSVRVQDVYLFTAGFVGYPAKLLTLKAEAEKSQHMHAHLFNHYL